MTEKTTFSGHPASTQTPTTNPADTKTAATAGSAATPASEKPPIFQFMGGPTASATPVDHSDLLLRSPTKFVETVLQDVDRKIEMRDQQKNARKKMWDEFYQENPDLKDVDWHVQSVLGEKLSEWTEKPVSEAKKLLAEESRRRIDLLKQKFGMEKETLRSESATTLPSSGETQAEVKVTPRPTSFVDEILLARRKKRA